MNTPESLVGDASKAVQGGSYWTEEEAEALLAKALDAPEREDEEVIILDSLTAVDADEPEQPDDENPNIDPREYRRDRSGSKKRENKHSNRKKAKAARAARKAQR